MHTHFLSLYKMGVYFLQFPINPAIVTKIVQGCRSSHHKFQSK